MKKLKSALLYIILPSSALLGLFSVFQLSWNIRPTQNWQMIQLHRKYILKSFCMKYKLTNSAGVLNQKVVRQMIVEHNHKLIYCEVPKTGCSNWKRIILVLQKNVSHKPNELTHQFVHNTTLLKRLSNYPIAKQKEMLKNYTKVMFTRDPFERLVSAYRNKFIHTEHSIYYSNILAGKIRAKFRNSTDTKGSVTFQEFVRWVLYEKPKFHDVHWRPMLDLCDPCNIQYDMLGKFSTLEEDTDHALKSIRAPRDLHLPNIKQHADDVQTNERITNEYFRSISSEHIEALVKMYHLDFTLFNYPIYITNTTF